MSAAAKILADERLAGRGDGGALRAAPSANQGAAEGAMGSASRGPIDFQWGKIGKVGKIGKIGSVAMVERFASPIGQPGRR